MTNFAQLCDRATESEALLRFAPLPGISVAYGYMRVPPDTPARTVRVGRKTDSLRRLGPT